MLIDELYKQLPGLKNDPKFKITSPCNRFYNCIAWAYGFYEDRWMQFDTRPRYDGVWYWWPPGVTVSPKIEAYVEAFETKGFYICENGELESGFIKVALYGQEYNGSIICTHAARQRRDGSWTSKLGQSHDICHGTAYSIEGNAYGKVICFMKKEFK